jgi:hypothetical protein
VGGSASGGIGGGGTTGSAGTGGTAGTTGSAGTAGIAGAGNATGTGGSAGAGGRGGTGAVAGATGTAGANGRGGTTGAAGAAGGTAGAAGTAGSAAMPQVRQQCQQDNSPSNVTWNIRIVNNGNQTINWSDITVRYWFSHTDTAMPVLDIDYSQTIDRAYITGKFTSTYLELGFMSAAGSLAAFDTTAGSGEIQTHFHPADYSPWDTSQSDDYSFQACAGSAYNLWMKTTAYVRGSLVWGVEPP